MRTCSRRSPTGSRADHAARPRARRRRRPAGALAAVAAVLALAPPPAPGQTPALVDQGRFEIRIGGAPRGQESFAIRRQGAEYMAVGRISREGAGVWIGSAEVGLRTDARFVPVRYEFRTLQRPVTRVIATRTGSRIRVTTSDQSGEGMTEIAAGPGLLLLQSGVAHHYWFLVRRLQGAEAGRGGTVEAVTPSDVRRAAVELLSVGPDSVAMPETARLPATRYEIRIGDAVHRVWVEQGTDRLLRAEVPEQDWIAVRVSDAAEPDNEREGSEP